MSASRIIYLTSDDIRALIPHRPPILLVDFAELSDGTAYGRCSLTTRPHLFAGHFPGQPILPGIYMLEAMAQLGAVLVLNSYPDFIGKLFSFGIIHNVKFRQSAVPDDEVISLRVKIAQSRITKRIATFRFYGEVCLGDKLVAEAEFSGTALIN